MDAGARGSGLRTRVGDPEVCETSGGIGETPPGFIGEDAVGDVGADGGGALANEHLGALDEGATGLHEVVDDDDVLALGLTFL